MHNIYSLRTFRYVRPSGGCNPVTRRRVCRQIPAYERHIHSRRYKWYVCVYIFSVDSSWIGRAYCVTAGLAGLPAAILELYPLYGQTGARVLRVVATVHSLQTSYIMECEVS